MAMYYQAGSSEIQPDHELHTLHLMNPNYVAAAPYNNSHHTQFSGMISLLSHHNNPNRPSSSSSVQQENIQATHNMISSIPLLFNHNSIWESSSSSLDHQTATTNTIQLQRSKNLSLSLSPHDHHQITPAGSFGNYPIHRDPIGINISTDHHVQNSSSSTVIMGSKFLKATQQLLDEVVNIGKGVNNCDWTVVQGSKGNKDKIVIKDSSIDGKKLVEANLSISGADQLITTAQRQEILMKKAKLVTLSDEVEQRYRLYHHQMQIIVASFEQAAKSYTHLALKTISKQFRCLKDAISEQINSLNKSLSNEERQLGEKNESSKFKFIDSHHHQSRQQRAMGMMQQNNAAAAAWRPQRGLPERAVSVLRAWLFENFLHPYPKDSDKQMLAKQTGLTRSQVSNWFINARVRLWKPMVEEMYKEEMKNNNNINQQQQQQIITRHDENIDDQLYNNAGLQFKQDDEKFISMEKNPSKRARNDVAQGDNSPSCSTTILSSVQVLDSTTTRKVLTSTGLIGGMDEIGELDRFDAQNKYAGFYKNYNNINNTATSLTLGLPPSGEHNFLSNFVQFGPTTNTTELTTDENGIITNPAASSHDPNNNFGYENINLDFQNQKTFPAQLFPDFLTPCWGEQQSHSDKGVTKAI